METNGTNQRRRWDEIAEQKYRKKESLYDEYLREQKIAQKPGRRSSVALPLSFSNGSTAASGSATSDSIGTMKAIKTEETTSIDGSMAESILSDRNTTSFERAFLPQTTTTIIGGPAALSGASSLHHVPKSRKLVKDARLASNGVARASSKSNSNSTRRINMSSVDKVDTSTSPRPRTRTLEENWRAGSPASAVTHGSNRVGSVRMPSSGAEYLASVPASTSSPAAPIIPSLSSPIQPPGDMAGRRSISPVGSDAAESRTSSESASRRIVYLMNTLKGRMGGNVVLRRERESPWTELYCYIKEDSGRLMYEPRGDESAHRTLVSSLWGCSVKANADGETPYLEVTLPQSDTELHFKLLTQADFDSWFAALLWWQYLEPRTGHSNEPRPPSSSTQKSKIQGRPELPPRTSSAIAQRDRAGSNKSDRRKSVVSSKEAPVIKIGKMIFWDTNIGYSNSPNPTSDVGQPTTGRPHAYRMQSFGSRRWRRISGQLRENGELKLHSDADNNLISVVQLSQLSRCAIQRLDPSVLENDFCIAIYPQYTSGATNNQTGFMRPMFLSLESRVLFEVWFVLLRAFTIPQLYGPPNATKTTNSTEEGSMTDIMEESEDLDDTFAATTIDMFRMERTLNIRIVEAKMYPPTTTIAAPEAGFSGGHNRGMQDANAKPEQHGYYAEVLLDNETRAKTLVKFEGMHPLWAESFEFLDLPPVLSSASVVIKRRPPDHVHAREQQESRLVHEAYGFTSDQHGGFTGLTFDVTCGKVEIFLQELEEEKEVEKWWPVVNMYNQRVGEVLIKTRTDEGVILMERDYKPLNQLLHRFSNGITLQIAQMVPTELKQLSDCLLNIFQVSGKVGDWIMALVEEEIDGIHKETPISKLRYSRRMGSDASHDHLGSGAGSSDRELIVRDLNRNATAEANLLFRGNTLLTKSLDSHMRRVGKEYLEDSLAAKMRDINEKDPDCEIDPTRLGSPGDSARNLQRLLLFTQEVWKCIVASKQRCPVELRIIFRHVRACADDRYGDFLRSVSYSSVSGFLFLRFFCPAVLNPKLFGLLKEDVKPRARRTFTLIAKTLQTLSNMASFGQKEEWMAPMNAFLAQNRESFKSFIDDMCYVPTPLSASTYSTSSNSSPTYSPGVISAETHLSYTTPMTIMQRLPPTSREGFPGLPYLIDQARAFAELVQLWLEATTAMSTGSERTASAKSHAEVMAAIKASEGDLMAFHEICTRLHKRTQECLNRAERAERPKSALSFQWEELIDQLQPSDAVDSDDELSRTQKSSVDTLAEKVANDASIIPSLDPPPAVLYTREWDVVPELDDDDNDDDFATRLYDTTPSGSGTQLSYEFGSTSDRPGSSGVIGSLRESLRRTQNQSRGSDSRSLDASASASIVSSTVSSDTEHTTGTTALPSYDREVRHRERREEIKQEIKRGVEAARIPEKEKDKRKVRTPIVSALRKKKERESRGTGVSPEGAYTKEGYASHG